MMMKLLPSYDRIHSPFRIIHKAIDKEELYVQDLDLVETVSVRWSLS